MAKENRESQAVFICKKCSYKTNADVNAALWCLTNTHNYQDCVLTAVNLGEDTDTTASVAGALAGAVYGLDAIPTEWIEKMRGRELIDMYVSESELRC